MTSAKRTCYTYNPGTPPSTGRLSRSRFIRIAPSIAIRTCKNEIENEIEMELLVSFHCQCRGVKFYDLRSAGAALGTKLDLVEEPTNPHDPLCVAAWVLGIPNERGAGVRLCMLGHGHVAKEAARWLSPLLGVPTLWVTRYLQ